MTVEADRLAALVERLQAETRDLAAAAAIWQERAGVLSEQLALRAPQEPVGAPQALDPSTESFRVLWRSWSRWWPAAVAVLLVLGLAGALLTVR